MYGLKPVPTSRPYQPVLTPVGLVHPLAVVRIALFVGVDVATLAVEADIAVLLTHVDLELACGTPALPAVVVVTETENALAESRAHTPSRGSAGKHKAQKGAAQDDETGQRRRPGKQQRYLDQHVDNDQVFGFDRYRQGEHVHFQVAKEHSERGQQAEDCSIGAGGCGKWTGMKDLGKAEGAPDQAAADRAQEVNFEQPAAAL